MSWNWQLPDWPNFTYTAEALAPIERAFLQDAGGLSAILTYLAAEERALCISEILTVEAMKSSEIEGEILDRESVRSSIKRHFGFKAEKPEKKGHVQGMAELTCLVYETYDEPLTREMLFHWHEILMKDDEKRIDVGVFRTHKEPMQIVSRRMSDSRVYFEAPPSHVVESEMQKFIERYNNEDETPSILGEAALLHVYFESIHPFEDGNGRIGRALVEKYLSKKLGSPTLIATSKEIERRKKEYYQALALCNRSLHISLWTQFFAEVVLSAQKESAALITFLVKKSHLMIQLAGKLNPRQEKALLRMFAEGVHGFSGGLSAENYQAITKASKATTTRDLADLVEKKALKKTGQLRHTRYWLDLKEGLIKSVLPSPRPFSSN